MIKKSFFRMIVFVIIFSLVISIVSCQRNITDDNDSVDIPESSAQPTTEAAKSPECIDLLDMAISMSKIDNALKKMPSTTYGSGAFSDYTRLHSNPLDSFSYPMEISALTSQITREVGGFSYFCYEIVASYGFEKDYSKLSYTTSNDIEAALEALYALCGTNEGLQEAKQAIMRLDKVFSEALAEYIWAAVYAADQNLEALKYVKAEDCDRLLQYSYCGVATEDPSSLELAKNLHNITREPKLLRSGLLLVRATCDLIADIDQLDRLVSDGGSLVIPTPFGDIIIGSGDNDEYESPDSFLLIEPSGDDTYKGSVAASRSTDRPISVVIDMSGNDVYTADQADGATQGCGVFGTGLLFDLKGNDSYTAYRLAQGAAMLGTGVLFDGEGNDVYDSKLTTQGAAYFGFATLIDVSGDDSYKAMAVAQASSGNRAMAFLVDKAGDDSYYVEPYEVEGFEFLDYGQFTNVNGNWSQGCGMGQRNIDISGGLAGLIDLEGNDVYTGGIWVQGVGYWSGIGFLTDMSGNDVHNSQYYSQASVAHYGVAMLIDVGGDDLHSIKLGKWYGGEGASMGFVWDRGVATLVNDGGNDVYISGQTSCGVAWSAYDDKGPANQDETYAFFIDTEGDDRYSKSNEPSYGYGLGGFFIDASGNDVYEGGGIRQNLAIKSKKNAGGVIIDYEPSDTEYASISVWNDARSKYFDE